MATKQWINDFANPNKPLSAKDLARFKASINLPVLAELVSIRPQQLQDTTTAKEKGYARKSA